ncbi:MAG: excalibur calcium-binding domain-containing protein [Parvularculaceae bacterium]|nr:excalibur calcium-binding domain-containing protein [Parvularculaceae bacterium]
MAGRWAMIVLGGSFLFSAVTGQAAPGDDKRARDLDATPPQTGRPYSRDLDCSDFTSWSEAQEILDADPRDRHALDGDHDGIACEALRYGGGF